jgi:CO dehydrogenase/acetyl-CoA synthase beta subunit
MKSDSRRLSLCGAATAVAARAAYQVEGEGRTYADREAEQNATRSDSGSDTVLDAMAKVDN